MRTKTIIMVEGNPVKIFTNEDLTHAYVFPPFGRYYQLSSDVNVLDFAAHFLLAKNNTNVITFQAYLNSDEDTCPMFDIEKIAA